jgi:hypothetical protein
MHCPVTPAQLEVSYAARRPIRLPSPRARPLIRVHHRSLRQPRPDKAREGEREIQEKSAPAMPAEKDAGKD